MAPPSAGIDFREVCDPYIPIAPETRGPVASLKDDRSSPEPATAGRC